MMMKVKLQVNVTNRVVSYGLYKYVMQIYDVEITLISKWQPSWIHHLGFLDFLELQKTIQIDQKFIATII